MRFLKICSLFTLLTEFGWQRINQDFKFAHKEIKYSALLKVWVIIPGHILS